MKIIKNTQLTNVFAFYFLIDKTSPVQGFLNDGAGNDLTHFQGQTISGNWSFSDAHSGIVNYEYAVGTSPNNDDVIAWSNVGTATTFTEAFTNGIIGQAYYVSVRATNGAGLIAQSSSNGQIYSQGDLSLEDNQLDQVIVFPNPFTDQLTIRHLPGKSTATLYDINGKVVFSGEVSAQNEQIFIGEINAGVYQLVLIHNEHKMIRKVIKN